MFSAMTVLQCQTAAKSRYQQDLYMQEWYLYESIPHSMPKSLKKQTTTLFDHGNAMLAS